MLLILVAGLLAVVVAHQAAPRVGVSAALILLAGAVILGLTPWVPAFDLDPDLILEVVLPALLFSTAASLPVMDFRREVVAVAGLAVGLVLLSTVALGALLHLLIPGLSLPWAIALAAVLSPTDAVAVSIARSSGVSQRIITVLEGEGLFNDATALVLLSSATAAGAAHDADALRPLSILGGFALALGVAIVVGWVVGELTVRGRSRITQAPVDTALTFAVPFLASVPAEHLGGSGLVAAVVAGLVMSYRGPRLLPPDYRRAGSTNWRTVELLLEGLIFITMGLQAYGIIEEVRTEGLGIGTAVWVAAVAAVVTILIRAAFVAGLIPGLRALGRKRSRAVERSEARVERIERHFAELRAFSEAADGDDGDDDSARGAGARDRDEAGTSDRSGDPGDRRVPLETRGAAAPGRGDDPGSGPEAHGATAVAHLGRRLRRERRRARRGAADLDYFRSEPLGAREGAVIVWAGMRGAITLAAAQTLPTDTPMRPLLLLIALIVAAGSLVIQGLTLTPLIGRIHPAMASEAIDAEERRRLIGLLSSATKETALSEAIAEHAADATGPMRVAGLSSSWSTMGRVMQEQHGRAGTPLAAESALDDADAVQEAADGALPPERASRLPADAQTTGGSGEERADAAQDESGTVGDDGGSFPLDAARVRELAIEAIGAQREALLDARDEGVFTSTTLEYAMARLDAEQIMLETHH